MLTWRPGHFAVVDLDPLGDPLLAEAVGQDDAPIAHAVARGFGGDGVHVGFCSSNRSGRGPRFGEAR